MSFNFEDTTRKHIVLNLTDVEKAVLLFGISLAADMLNRTKDNPLVKSDPEARRLSTVDFGSLTERVNAEPSELCIILGTCHIPDADLEKLNNLEGKYPVIMEREESTLVHLPQGFTSNEQFLEVGFSKEFIDVLTQVESDGFHYVLFDRDGPTGKYPSFFE